MYAYYNVYMFINNLEDKIWEWAFWEIFEMNTKELK